MTRKLKALESSCGDAHLGEYELGKMAGGIGGERIGGHDKQLT
jgi:hypothetical protein